MGTVQWFSRVKGYGFIRPDEQEEDVFVHYSVIRGEGYRNLNRGQRVEFMMEDTPKGPQAVDVLGLETEVELDVEGELETGINLETEVELEAEAELDAGEAETGEGYA
jgi:CspA family cold shock protein